MQQDTRPSPVMFRDQDIERELLARGENRNTIAKRDLERYYDLLARMGRRLRFDEDDLAAIVAVTSTVMFADTAAPYLIADEVTEAEDELTAILGARARGLIERLRALHPAEKLALTDMVERDRIERRYEPR